MWTSISVMIAIALLVLLALALFSRDRTSGTAFGGRPYLVYGEDGLWDLYVGAILLVLAVAERFELSTIAFVPILLYPVLLAAKQAITAPRLNAAEQLRSAGLRAGERRTLLFLVLGLTVPLVLLLVVRTVASLGFWLSQAMDTYLPAVLQLLLVALLAAWGYRSGMHRLIAYAASLAAIHLAGYLVELPPYALNLLMGVVVTAGGLAVLARFIHSHPTHGQMHGT